MKLSKRMVLLAVIVALIPLGIYAYNYPHLPQQVATHFDFSGQANGYTNRDDLWLIMLTPLIFIPLFVILPRIDPRGKSYEKLGKFYPAFVLGLIGMFAALLSSTILNALPGVHVPIEKLTPLAVGLLFLVMGNYMPKMKQSYTMGIKTPWTLHSEVVWNKTHRIAGPCFMVAGMLMLIGLFLPTSWMFGLVMAGVVIAVGVPGGMSYVYYRQEEK